MFPSDVPKLSEDEPHLLTDGRSDQIKTNTGFTFSWNNSRQISIEVEIVLTYPLSKILQFTQD